MIYIIPINYGYETGTIGQLIAFLSFLAQFGEALPSGGYEVTSKDQQILTAGLVVGVFIAAFGAGFISDRVGRKWTIVVSALLCIAGVIIQILSTSIAMLFGGKLVSSVGFGLGLSSGPVYVAEIAPAEIRGICLTMVVSRFS
jgi:MFS family permease